MRRLLEVAAPRGAALLLGGLLPGVLPGCAEPASMQQGAPAAPGEWVRLTPMPEERTEVSVATDGRLIYVIGGFRRAGGVSASAPRAMLAYDAAADTWSSPDSIPAGVNHAGFVHLEGKLYLVGGYRENTFEPTGAVWIYDLAARKWSEGAPMLTPRGALAVAVVEGKIHAIGGTVSDPSALDAHDHNAGTASGNSVGTHEVYDPATNRWARRTPMPTARNHHGAAAVGGRIYVPAGRVNRDFELTVHEVYDPGTDSWSRLPPVPTGRSGIAVVALAGRVYVFGGETVGPPVGKTFDEAERFDPAAGRWESLPPMPTARHGLSAAVVGGSIYVISGGPQPGFAFSGANERLTPVR